MAGISCLVDQNLESIALTRGYVLLWCSCLYLIYGNMIIQRVNTIFREKSSNWRSYCFGSCSSVCWISCERGFSTAPGLNCVFELYGFFFTIRIAFILASKYCILFHSWCMSGIWVVWGGLGSHKHCFWNIWEHQGCYRSWGCAYLCEASWFPKWWCQGTGKHAYWIDFSLFSCCFYMQFSLIHYLL